MSIKKYKRILLFSGGIDSFVAYYFLGKPKTLYFDLKNRYSEKEKKVIKRLIPTTIIDDTLNLGDIEKKNANIPFRNLFLAMKASAKYADKVYIVGIKDDKVSDKNKKIFKTFSDLLSKLEGRKIEILSPFWEMSKKEILIWYLERGLSKETLLKTISCYSSSKNTTYCGKCACCFRKWVALYSIGIKLPFYNKKLINVYRKRCQNNYYTKERNKITLIVIKQYEQKIGSNRH